MFGRIPILSSILKVVNNKRFFFFFAGPQSPPFGYNSAPRSIRRKIY